MPGSPENVPPTGERNVHLSGSDAAKMAYIENATHVYLNITGPSVSPDEVPRPRRGNLVRWLEYLAIVSVFCWLATTRPELGWAIVAVAALCVVLKLLARLDRLPPWLARRFDQPREGIRCPAGAEANASETSTSSARL